MEPEAHQMDEDYIRANYPLNPNWHLKDEIEAFFAEMGLYCDSPEEYNGNYFPSGDPECLYLKQEMYRLRGKVIDGEYVTLGYFHGGNPDSLFFLREDMVDAWTNVDEMVWRTGNGVYDPPERFREEPV